MSKIIAASIDLAKLDKTRIVEGKNGAKYYNITIMCNDTKDQYGNDVAIQTGLTKEERAAGTKATYVGNGKTVFTSPSPAPSTTTHTTNPNDIDDLPF